MKTILFYLSLFSLLPAFAGHEVGNGGDAVVCYENKDRLKIVSVEMFDYWEGERVFPHLGKINFGQQNTVKGMIEEFTNRISVHDPVLGGKIKDIALGMANNIEPYLVTGYDLPEIDDANPRALPNNPCFIEQFAVQWKDLGTGQRRFAIAKKFYDFAKTSNTTKVGILLHEAIYRNAILRGHTNSDGSRFFNFAMATPFTLNQPLSKYVQILESAKLAQANCRLVEVFPGQNQMYFDTNGIICLPFTLTYPYLKITTNKNMGKAKLFNLENENKTLWIEGAVQVQWKDRNNQWKTIDYTNTHFYFKKNELTSMGWSSFKPYFTHPLYMTRGESMQCVFDADYQAAGLFLSAEGEFLSCNAKKGATVKVHGQLTTIYYDFTLHPNREIARVWTDNGIMVPIRGSQKSLLLSGLIEFDTFGNAIFARPVEPITFEVEGHKITVKQFEVDKSSNKIPLDLVVGFKPNVDGKPILYQGDDPENFFFQLCKKQNFHSNKSFSEIEEKYFPGVNQFYDFVSNSLVYKTDETVNFLSTDYYCQKRVLAEL
ncbi:MAG: hypothetical protein ACOYL6_19105 [Bacteriovoracaceae bacterium]